MGLAAAIDLLHALLMVAWVAGLPLLFARRWPRVTLVYAVFAIAFVVVNQLSYHLLGECFLTTLARMAWQHGAPHAPRDTGEWFTVRLAKWVFGLTPSHRAVKLASEGLIVITAVGVVLQLRRSAHAAVEDDETGNAQGVAAGK